MTTLLLPMALEEIRDLFDCQVVSDMTDDDDGNMKDVFWLGSTGDMSVGIQAYELTRGFDSHHELRVFVESPEGRAEINRMAAETFPEWDEVAQDWDEPDLLD